MRPVDIRRDGISTVDIVVSTHPFVRTYEQVDWTIYNLQDIQRIG